jgi:hypothetical protein
MLASLLVASSLVVHITPSMPLLFSLSFFFVLVCETRAKQKTKNKKKKEMKIEE